MSFHSVLRNAFRSGSRDAPQESRRSIPYGSTRGTPRPPHRDVLRGAGHHRIAAVVATPLLALCVACGSGDGGARTSDGIATVTDEPTAGRDAAPGKDGSAGPGKDAGKASAGEGRGAFYDAQMKYVRCMRTKGEFPDFPDPRLSGHLDWEKIDEVVAGKGNGEGYKGGRNAVCFPEMAKADELAPKRNPQQDYESMLAHAKCMRENGVPKFTNPTMSGGNVIPGGDPNPANPEVDPESPAYKQARQACKGKLLEGLDGMQ
ncbi:hypothetical protein ACMA1D_10095 [Streptomyces sp. 796.1]|uniref:hypothetical protein n=1 Tax=Streptomyces sp. 796.1 TaxID=3163029 RepID=UPI0039C94302